MITEVFRDNFSPASHSNVPRKHMTSQKKISPHEKDDTKLYIAIDTYLHINPVQMHTYDDKTSHFK